MFLLLLIILILSIIALIYWAKADTYDNDLWVNFIMNLFIGIVSLAGIIHIIGHENNKKPKITDKVTNTKDSIIIKDSLLILNMNDTVKVLNINKL